jgi:hypothetical protein
VTVGRHRPWLIPLPGAAPGRDEPAALRDIERDAAETDQEPRADGCASTGIDPATREVTREARGNAELLGALRMVAEGHARRMTLAGFTWRADQVAEIEVLGRTLGVRVVPTIAYGGGGGGVDLVVVRGDRPRE